MEEIDRLVDQNQPELERTFAKKHGELIAATEVFRHTLETCKSRGWDVHAQLWNVGIYINIAAHDLSVLVMQLHFERDLWTRKQIARPCGPRNLRNNRGYDSVIRQKDSGSS